MRDILGEVDQKLRYYCVMREKREEFIAEFEKIQVIREKDQGNIELEKVQVRKKEEIPIHLKKFVCMRVLGVEGFGSLEGVVSKNKNVYCDKPVNINKLLNLSQEYTIEDGELPTKGYLKFITDVRNLQKMNLSKSRIIH